MTSHSRFPPLKKGSQIGIIAPAGQLQDINALDRGVNILHEMGFELKLPRQLWPGYGYLADSDQNRALEFHKMWTDPEIDAIMALRGGFGCLRLLPFLDMQEIAKHQKILIGFSDVTILHQAFFNANNVISFHGPVLTSLSSLNRKSLERFRACLHGKWNIPIEERSIEILRGGDPALGKLIGGNLSSLISMIGTPFDLDWRDSILFLEDIGEPFYRIDRMLTQLEQCGKLAQLKGILLGDFSLTSEMDRLESIRFHEQIWNRVLELTEQAGMPIWANFPIGHCPTNLTLPYGADAGMDSSQVLLSFK